MKGASRGFSFLGDRFTLSLHGFHEVGGGGSFERQSIADFSNDALLQWLNEVDAGVSAGHLRSFQVQFGQFPRPAESLTVRHNLGNHSPFIRCTRRQWLWIEQERLRSSCSSTITPGCKDSDP